KNVLVTNGTASIETLEEILPLTDAMNIDLKGFRESYYRELGGDLETVKEFILRAAAGCHVELTTLIVPGKNDTISEMEEEAKWIASVEAAVGKKIPLHITRFFPRYHMTDREATEVKTVYGLAETAKKYLEYVFVGNC
ncbi:MAG: radical SAM protein, partial [Lachnospiraceae bacterium]|nr:radical SAM protein [Lachnospiraceae bacterium]